MKLSILLLLAVLNIVSCSHSANTPVEPTVQEPEPPHSSNTAMRITVNDKVFSATLASNSTAMDFAAMLPLKLKMQEMNGNEKYASLPSALKAPGGSSSVIKNGDIMLYGTSTLVLFYKSFSTSYSYTRIATIDDASSLETALGRADVEVKFEIDEYETE